MVGEVDVVARYVLDGSDEDLRRLLKISSVLAPTTRAAITAAPIDAGWTVLECGCGPLGAMAILSELVGAEGRVVGLDFNPGTVERARSVVDELGLRNVEVQTGDINDSACDAGGPYDLAFTRCFLMHQSHPQHTLERIAAHLRPGGWIVAMEPLWSPTPFAHPPMDAVGTAWEMLNRAAVSGGAAPAAVADLADSARRAGLTVARSAGSFQYMDPEIGFALHAATTTAARDRIIATGAATAGEVDAVIAELEQARSADGWVSTPVSLVLALRAIS
ncbi:MAG TPA: class I SAM-dependent methyltransferase [Jatrophihabitantaceae bacterium]|nr:class I SAM-dependent methyltransferase [Jatrophihabitantaceae bacterium]